MSIAKHPRWSLIGQSGQFYTMLARWLCSRRFLAVCQVRIGLFLLDMPAMNFGRDQSQPV
jgi:hypothetical protein